MGRPLKLTDRTSERICELLRRGVPRERAARLAGEGASTFHVWLAEGAKHETGKYREFLEAVCTAEDDLVERAIGAVVDLFGPNADGKPSDRLNAAKFILSHRFNKEFSSRQEVTGADGGAVQLEGKVDVTVRPMFSNEQLAAMTPEQLAAAIGGMVGPAAVGAPRDRASGG